MKYVVLVSHGTFAPGLHSVLKMLAGGEREDVISVGLEDGMSADEFAEKLKEVVDANNYNNTYNGFLNKKTIFKVKNNE